MKPRCTSPTPNPPCGRRRGSEFMSVKLLILAAFALPALPMNPPCRCWIFRAKPRQTVIAAGTAEVFRATPIPGYNDHFAGAAPDLGAYEAGAAYWVPGAAGFAVPGTKTQLQDCHP